jgi:hypothetical protein
MLRVVPRSRGLVLFTAIAAAALAVSGAAAGPEPVPGQQAALAAVKRAVQAGRLDRASAAAARAEIARAVRLIRVLPVARRGPVEVALEEVGALGRRLTSPRSLAVVGQLRVNDDYFASHGAPSPGSDVTDADGIVYRYFPGRCFEFHPLATFSALNALVAARDEAGAQRLAAALVARAVPLRGGGLGWEYYFPYADGRPPWLSGMAQAVAAQAFARVAALVPVASALYLQEASAAFRAIPGRLTTRVAAGPWIRLYSFRSVPVLNAQLQTVLSLRSYATATGDAAAAALAAQMEQAAAATLPRFDTGYWTYYSLAGAPSSLSYHEYVIRLLRRLSADDERFGEAAARFAAYLRQPPAFELAPSSAGALRFWLSKPASVTVSSAVGGTRRLTLDGGWHTLAWPQPSRPGIYGVTVAATGPAGNRASFSALPLVRLAASASRPARSARRRPVTAGSTPQSATGFSVGAGIDAPVQAGQAAALGLGLVRLTVPWQAGESAPDPAIAASLQAMPAEPRLVLELGLSELPADETTRAELARYAASLAAVAPSLRYLVLAPAPALKTAAAYADALTALRAAVRTVRPDVAVGPSVDGSAQPERTTLALARELARDGGAADVVEFHPAALLGQGWTADAVDRLEAALAKALGAEPPLLLDAQPVGATVPPSQLAAYGSTPPPAAGAVTPGEQASAYARAVGTASCSPHVAGVLLDRLVDEGSPTAPATGLYYPTGRPKPAAGAVRQAIGQVARGAVVCPGTAVAAEPAVLELPSQLSPSSPATLELACNRDCLYLVMLERAGGRPLASIRGALAGGAPARTIVLPAHGLPPGRYRLDLRLVSRADPGPVTRRLSPLLVVR